ncbi:hypothetical protein E0493_13540 [Roseomonas sp. M0104]|uniref:Uncharacterized protein n=1 Tax=Teichococcus coralli TaxID=2545983 RepID=A0A845BLT0_9PROT|nr:hypothetical protein [Pseudoroseomonas coralli]MXP64369.1 hypothetical protein [Pseudoroseomonas coralli]
MTQSPSGLRALDPDLDRHVPRAGDDAEQRRLGLLAWEMAEIWTVPPPHGERATRFSADWLRHKGWCVAFVSDQLSATDEARLFQAVRSRGHNGWFGTAVDPRGAELTAVWKWGFAEGDFGWFHTAHSGVWVMGFTAERDFAFIGDGDGLVTLAGPMAFLCEALGDLRKRWTDFEEEVRIPQSERYPPAKAYFDAFMAHYEPIIAHA